MASRNQQSHAKRARELAVKEKRELKRAKKAARLAGESFGESDDQIVPDEGEGLEGQTETAGDTTTDGVS